MQSVPITTKVRISLMRAVLDTTLCDKDCQWLATGWWFSSGTPVSSTIKTDRHDITEIVLKVSLNTITLTHNYIKTNVTSHIFFQILRTIPCDYHSTYRWIFVVLTNVIAKYSNLKQGAVTPSKVARSNYHNNIRFFTVVSKNKEILMESHLQCTRSCIYTIFLWNILHEKGQ